MPALQPHGHSYTWHGKQGFEQEVSATPSARKYFCANQPLRGWLYSVVASRRVKAVPLNRERIPNGKQIQSEDF
jgi:hypothetical protein